MHKKIFIAVILFVFSIFFSTASVMAANEFVEAKNLINQKVSCDSLNQGQMEQIGDYLMEQMVPGVAHTQMDQMMGGEGSESLRQAHIFMARRWYCGDAAGFSMMGMMMGSGYPYISGRGFSMMGAGYYGWFNILQILGIVFLISGIAVFIKYLFKK